MSEATKAHGVPMLRDGTFNRLRVSISRQEMVATHDSAIAEERFRISTAKNGVGQESGSECTPLGSHRIRAKIGANAPTGSVFVGRRLTGEVYTEVLAEQHPGRDWILTRIMWLCGNETGLNRLGSVDTQRRYIYIHGCPDSHELGKPSSHGCIKMYNKDIERLFDLVEIGCHVDIEI